MKNYILLYLFVLFLSGCGATQSDTDIKSENNNLESTTENVTLIWQNPDDFRDVRGADEHKDRARKRVFNAMHQHLLDLAEDLPENTHLTLTFTDIDLAGDVRYLFDMGREMRVMERHYWPLLKFNAELKKSDAVLLEESVDLKEMMYLDISSPRLGSSDPLRYEKEMLTRWFKKVIEPAITN